MSQPYQSLEALFHDAFWEADDDGSELRLMDDFLRRHPGRALEIGSGSGRLLLPLRRLGHEIEGLELSPDMLALARAQAGGTDVLMHEGDMSVWRPAAPYAAVLAPAFTLQLAADPAATLEHWRSFLVPGGFLYLTLFTPLAELAGELPEGEWFEDHAAVLPDGREARLETRFRLDRGNRVLHREHRYSLGGPAPRRHESRQTLRWIEARDLPALAESCGFRLDRWFPDFDPTADDWDPEDPDVDGIVTCHLTKFR